MNEKMTSQERNLAQWLSDSAKAIESDHAIGGYSFKSQKTDSIVAWEGSEDRHEKELNSISVSRFYQPYGKNTQESVMLKSLYKLLTPKQRRLMIALMGQDPMDIAKQEVFESMQSGELVLGSWEEYQKATRKALKRICNMLDFIKQKAEKLRNSE